MRVTLLHLDPGAQARTLLHHLLQAGDVIGRDASGRTLIQLTAEDWLLEQLMTFDAGSEDGEDSGDVEPDDSPVVLSFDRAPKRRIYRHVPSVPCQSKLKEKRCAGPNVPKTTCISPLIWHFDRSRPLTCRTAWLPILRTSRGFQARQTAVSHESA